MGKFGFQEIRIHMGLFNYTVIAIVGAEEKVQKYVRWKFEDPEFKFDVGARWGACCYRPGYVPILWIPRKPKTTEEMGTLAHEALHAIFRLLGWAGMPADESTEEVLCHGVSHIVKTVLTKVK